MCAQFDSLLHFNVAFFLLFFLHFNSIVNVILSSSPAYGEFFDERTKCITFILFVHSPISNMWHEINNKNIYSTTQYNKYNNNIRMYTILLCDHHHRVDSYDSLFLKYIQLSGCNAGGHQKHTIVQKLDKHCIHQTNTILITITIIIIIRYGLCYYIYEVCIKWMKNRI